MTSKEAMEAAIVAAKRANESQGSEQRSSWAQTASAFIQIANFLETNGSFLMESDVY